MNGKLLHFTLGPTSMKLLLIYQIRHEITVYKIIKMKKICSKEASGQLEAYERFIEV